MKKFIVVVGLLAVNVLAGCGHGRGACAHEKGGTAAEAPAAAAPAAAPEVAPK